MVIILFLTKKNNDDKKSDTTPLIQYIQNYKGKTKSENKIIYLTDGIGNVKYELENFTGECYILIYDKTWMTSYDKDSATYKAYEKVDSYLTGSKTSSGTKISSDPMLDAISNCGQDIKFFVVDFKSIEKNDDDKTKNPVYFTMGGVQFANLLAPSLFHYKSSESSNYTGMDDKEHGLLLADGSVYDDGKPKYPASYWGQIIANEVNYINKIDEANDNNK